MPGAPWGLAATVLARVHREVILTCYLQGLWHLEASVSFQVDLGDTGALDMRPPAWWPAFTLERRAGVTWQLIGRHIRRHGALVHLCIDLLYYLLCRQSRCGCFGAWDVQMLWH